MNFVVFDKLYHGFSKTLTVTVLHLFHNNSIFYNLRVPDQDRVLPAKQQIVVEFLKKIFNVFLCKKVKLVHSFSTDFIQETSLILREGFFVD